MTSQGKALVVSLLAIVAAGLISIRVMSQVGWDPTIFVAFGRDATPSVEFAEERLGDVFLRSGQGHDGKFFFIQAHDPLILDPEDYALALDRPLYRSQRMLYPLLVGGFGVFGSETIVWSMLVVNLVAMGAGTFATARVAQRMGGTAWWGLAFALNVGLVSEVNIGGAGVIAAALAFGAVAAVLAGKNGMAVALLVLSALSREVFLVAAGGIALWLVRRGERRTAIAVVAAPITAVAVWAVYLRARIGWDAGISEVREVGLPFVGFIQAIPHWLDQPLNLAAGTAVLLLFVVYVRRTLISDALVGWAFIGFVPLALLFTKQVWLNYFDITRAVGPIITSFVLMMFLTERVRGRLPTEPSVLG